MNDKLTNQQAPAFPVYPVQDQFGQVHVFPGMTKQEYLAALIFADSFKIIRQQFLNSEYESNEDVIADVKAAKRQALDMAEIFFTTNESKLTSL
jgi:hypothetical protein